MCEWGVMKKAFGHEKEKKLQMWGKWMKLSAQVPTVKGYWVHDFSQNFATFTRDNIQEVAMLPHFFILSLQLFIHRRILKLQLFNHYVNSNPLCKLFPNFFLHFLVCILGFSFIV
jgi:hypothetical protein